jgi:DNA-binding HxlR family transcriptional regulator
MPTNRSYGDACGIARALDVVGERWALLVVRELLFGARRFSDLRRALPHASSNLVADRLRELEAHGVVHRRKLAPPANSWVYELTDRGGQLEPIVLALGEWGIDVPPPAEPTSLSAASILIYLRTVAHPPPRLPPATCRVELDGGVWAVRLASGRLDIRFGEPSTWDVALTCDPATLRSLIDEPGALDAHLADGSIDVTGDASVLRRLFPAVTASAGRATSAGRTRR